MLPVLFAKINVRSDFKSPIITVKNECPEIKSFEKTVYLLLFSISTTDSDLIKQYVCMIHWKDDNNNWYDVGQ